MNVVAPTNLTLHPSRRAQASHDAAVRCEERRRIGRELHDSTSQLLVALQLNLACLKVSSDETDTHSLFCALDETLQELHAKVRAVSSSDETPALQESLPVELRVMAKRFALFAAIRATLTCKGHYVSHSKEVEMSLYRIAQEALANVARHAHARQVRVQLDCTNDGTLKLTIEDDGVGFGSCKKRNLPEAGAGIDNIRQRVREMGGRLTLRRLRCGSRVTVTIHSQFLPAAAA